MIHLSAAGKRYAHKLLFENVDWLITAQDRVGLVGANGTGKSTMLKILGGLETVDYGSLSVTRGISAGYLPRMGCLSRGSRFLPSAWGSSPICGAWSMRWKS